MRAILVFTACVLVFLPLHQQPAWSNPAWGGLEPNHARTDEHMRFCKLLGCGPLIRVNTGNGASRGCGMAVMRGPAVCAP